MKVQNTSVVALSSALILAIATPSRVDAQLLVHPRRPSQTNVRYARFDWRYVDLLRQQKLKLDIEWQRGPRLHLMPYTPPEMGAAWAWPALSQAPIGPLRAIADAPNPTASSPAGREAMQTAGGIRLYFYERERAIAERAAAGIEQSYRYLAEQFAYAPRKTFAYFLYSSYIEFLQTDLFPIQEGVLGVTSPESLDLTLPYFGDQRMFEEVSTHELAHEFTIQKMQTVAEAAELSEAPLESMPLWFIEGLAEFYAKRGLDPEAEVLVRDLILNPTDDGYVLGDFFEDRFTDGLWTYKVGQARCAFLEETYGNGTLQRMLEESPRLARTADHGGLKNFRALVADVTAERASRISARFERWIKRRAFHAYLDTTQDRVDMASLSYVDGLVQTLSTSPSGHVLFYRSIDRDTGTTSLYLADRHAPRETQRVAVDGSPGVESLHPVSGRNFDLTDTTLSYVAENGGHDVIYVQRFDHDAVPEPCSDKGKRASLICGWDIDFSLRPRRTLRVDQHGLLTVDALAISPDGRSLVFIGLTKKGQKDLFLVPSLDDDNLTLVRLTHDVAAEREVSWGPNGIIFTSDATSHGKFNLFHVDPQLPTRITRLTHEARDEFDPEMLPDGRVLFVAYDHAGANIYEVKDGSLLRHTDVSTGLYDISPGPDGSVWALYHNSHRRRPVRLAASALLAQPVGEGSLDASAHLTLARPIVNDRAYDPLNVSNWAPDGLFVLAGFSGGGVFGSLSATASDRLHDHGLILSTSMYGSFDLVDAELTYINQERRVIWGLGVFHTVGAIYDQTFQKTDDVSFVSYQRFFGPTGILRFPLSRFFYTQAELSLGGAEYFVPSDTAEVLRDPDKNRADRDLLTPWEADNQDVRFNSEAGLSLGFSTIGMHRATGPIRGSSILLSHMLGTQPFDDITYQQTRLDTEHYVRLIGASNLMLRGALGTTYGDRHAPQFFLSSFHTLRGVPYGDTDFLLGREFFYSTLELQFPIATFIEFPLVDLEGVLGADFGGAGHGTLGVWERRVLDLVFGLNLGFAPIVLRFHFAQPIDIGVKVPNAGDLTFNLSMVWRYL